MLVSCPYRADHKIRKGHMHGPSQCPPPQGKRGSRYHSLHPKRETVIAPLLFDVRGVTATGMHGGKAGKHRAGRIKAKDKKV